MNAVLHNVMCCCCSIKECSPAHAHVLLLNQALSLLLLLNQAGCSRVRGPNTTGDMYLLTCEGCPHGITRPSNNEAW
jgi:hypothetical protein